MTTRYQSIVNPATGEPYTRTEMERHADMDYVLRRNMLVPQAEKYANELHGKRPPEGGDPIALQSYAQLWNRAFLGKMDELWRAQR